MPRIEPGLLPVVTDLDRGLGELQVPFGIVGALVPELLLGVKPRQLTNDADITVVVQSLDDYERLKDRLGRYGFQRTDLPYRMRHRTGGLLDILPFSTALVPEGRLELREGLVLNMAGFDKVVPNAVPTPIEGGPTLPVAPLPLYSLLKLVAYDDRKEPKDLAGVLHSLEHYLEDDDRRYAVEHEGKGVPYEYTCAYLLGVDARPFIDEPLARAAAGVLDQFTDADSVIVGIVAKERFRLPAEDADRANIWELFQWYRFGIGI